MSRRKGKSNNKPDDSWLHLEPTVVPTRGFNEYVPAGVLFLILVLVGLGLGWVYSEQQQTIESLSETLASVQARVNKLQQQFGPGNAQLANVGGFEDRLVALEEAYAKAQRQVEIALVTSEQIMSKDLNSKVWSLKSEINSKLAELQQNTISIAALNAVIKNKSTEFEVVKQTVNSMQTTNSELAITISGFTNTLAVTKSHLDEQISVVDRLVSQLEAQNKEISKMKELFTHNQEELTTNAQELMDIKKLLEMRKIKGTHVPKKQAPLHRSLEDNQSCPKSLNSHSMAQLETIQTTNFSRAQQPSKVEDEVQVKDRLATEADKEQIATADNKAQAPGVKAEYVEEQVFVEEPAESDEGQSTQIETFEENGASEQDEISEKHKVRVGDEMTQVSEQFKEELLAEKIYTTIKKEPITTNNIEENAEEKKKVAITKETQATTDLNHLNKIEEMATDQILIYFKDSVIATTEARKAAKDQIEVTRANMVTNEIEELEDGQSSDQILAPVEDADITTAENIQTQLPVSEESVMTTNENKMFTEKYVEENVAEERNNHLNEIFTGGIDPEENGLAE